MLHPEQQNISENYYLDHRSHYYYPHHRSDNYYLDHRSHYHHPHHNPQQNHWRRRQTAHEQKNNDSRMESSNRAPSGGGQFVQHSNYSDSQRNYNDRYYHAHANTAANYHPDPHYNPRYSPIQNKNPTFVEDNGASTYAGGCNCKKINCLKKYCDCFKAGLKCNSNCRCVNCQNY